MDDLIQLIKGLPKGKRKLLADLLLSDVPSEPIAIIGIGCRFPGDANDPVSFWQLLREGFDAITEVPPERWDAHAFYDPDPEAAGKVRTKWGGFLRDVECFDPSFFGITPREALYMDPQQRILLEVAWEALEDAGLSVDTLRGSSTGVFVGASMHDYGRQLQYDLPANLEQYDTYTATGTSLCIASNRLSYCFHLTGPSMTLDTACSSSLVAVHQACRSLRSGESTMAIAGGASLMLLPAPTVVLKKLMAADGRCKAFDARADGFVRGEGVGLIVLERLDRALERGRSIYAVIRGSAVNQDGFSGGLTVPSSKAQQRVIEAALEDASMTPARLGYIEAHGTGTALGDPIEAAALGAVLGKRQHPCAIGSVKTNFGHLEAAAGIAGLIKTVLALHHRQLPPSLHFSEPNPAIAFDELSLRVQRRHEPWAANGQPRVAGVSSFGFGGTNAHVILEEAPPPREPLAPRTTDPNGPFLLPISARSRAALEVLAASYERELGAEPAPALADVCHSAATRRAHLEHRHAVVGHTREEVRQALASFAKAEPPARPGLGAGRPRVVLAFAGQGGHWPRMGLAQWKRRPVLVEQLERCNAVLLPLAGWSLLDELRADPGSSNLGRTDVAQPTLAALQIAIAAQWKAWGIVPDAVVGHSVGEIAAIHVAGGLTLEDALTIAHHRGRLMQRSAGRGKMAAVTVSEAEARSLLDELGTGADLSVAAVNSPRSVTLSGEPSALTALLEHARSRGIRGKLLDVDHAFHSAQMEPFRRPFVEALGGLRPTPMTIPVYSTVTGQPLRDDHLDAAYWERGMRDPVRFSDAMAGAIAGGHRVFLEIGPHRVLATPILECLEHHGAQGVELASLRRDRPEDDTMLRSLAELYTLGVNVDFTSVLTDGGHGVRLPSYPWQRKRYWIPAPELTHPKAIRGKTIPSEYYDAVTEVSHDLLEPLYDESYLIFAPFPEIRPGFSWVHAFLSPRSQAEHFDAMLAAQKEMKAALFRHVDFSKVERVMDYGCGYGTDLLTLAGRHPHLSLYGYSISAKQIEVGQEKARRKHEHERVHLFCRDSSKDEFPATVDLAFGFEVTHHIKDKASLFGNIGRNLNVDGMLVIADFISNVDAAVDHELTSSYFSTREEWATLLASNGLELVDCVDVSREIGNFLYDDQFEEHLQELCGAQPDPNVEAAGRSYDQLGKMLHKRLASYVLLTAVKRQAPRDGLLDENHRRLGQQIPYDQVACGRWFRDVRWQPAEDDRPVAPQDTVSESRWLVFADDEVAPPLLRHLRACGAACVAVVPGSGLRRLDTSRFDGVETFELDPLEPEQYHRLVAEALGDQSSSPCQALYLWGARWPLEASADAARVMDDQRRRLGGALYLVQALSAAPGARKRSAWLVTCGLAADALDVRALVQAPLMGLARVAALEHPDACGGLVDVDPAEGDAMVQALCTTVLSAHREPHIALRGGQRLVQRLVRSEGPRMVGKPLALRADATYLVTGGFGALGMHLVRWMVEHGAMHLALVGRNEPGGAARALIGELRGRGVRIHELRANVSDAAALQEAFHALEGSAPPLRGVVHAAGIVDDGVLIELPWDRVERVLAPKVAGAWNLHRLTERAELDFFVLFSSGAAALGAAGQASYAAANAFLDALARFRRGRGLPGSSIAWGPWRGGGMTQALDAHARARWQQRGVGEIAAEQGLLLFEWLLQSDRPYTCVVPTSTTSTAQTPHASSSRATATTAPASILRQLEQSYASDRMDILRSHVREQIEQVLGIEGDVELEPQKPLLELGMDSLMALELRNNLGKSLARVLPASLLFDHPTWQALSEHLGYEILGLARPHERSPPMSDLDRELEQLENLSDDEAEALLAAYISGRDDP